MPFISKKLGYEVDTDNDFAMLMAWTDHIVGGGRNEEAMISSLETDTDDAALVEEAVKKLEKDYDGMKAKIAEEAFRVTADELQGRVETMDTGVDSFRELMASFQEWTSKFLGEDIRYGNEADRWTLYRVAILALRAGGKEEFRPDMALMELIKGVSGEFFSIDRMKAEDAMRMPGAATLRGLSDLIHERKAKGEDTTSLEVVFNVHMRAFKRGKKINTCYDFVRWARREIDNTDRWLDEHYSELPKEKRLAQAIKDKKAANAAKTDFYVPMFIVYLVETKAEISNMDDLLKPENGEILQKMMTSYFEDMKYILDNYKEYFTAGGHISVYDTNNPVLLEAAKKWVRFYRENFWNHEDPAQNREDFKAFMEGPYKDLVTNEDVKKFLQEAAGVENVESLMSEDMMVHGGYLARILLKYHIDPKDKKAVRNFCDLARYVFRENESLVKFKVSEGKETIKYFIGLGEIMGTLDSVARRSSRTLTDVVKDDTLMPDIKKLLKKYRFEYVEISQLVRQTEGLFKGKIPTSEVVMVTAPIVNTKFNEIGTSISIKDRDNRNLVTFTRVHVQDRIPEGYARDLQKREILVYRMDSAYPQEIFRLARDIKEGERFTLDSLVGAIKIGNITLEDDGKGGKLLVKTYLEGYRDGLNNVVVKIDKAGYGHTVYEEKIIGEKRQKIYYEYYPNGSLKSVRYEGVAYRPDSFTDQEGYLFAEQHGFIVYTEYEPSDDPLVNGPPRLIRFGDGTESIYENGYVKRIVFGNPHRPINNPADYVFAEQHGFITEKIFDGSAEERDVLTRYKDGSERRYATAEKPDAA
jgi:hypothetical protein